MPVGDRNHPRIPLEVEVTLESEHNFYTGISQNISEGGIFVATIHPPPLGSAVSFQLLLENQRFQVHGTVVWVRHEIAAQSHAPAGCGIRWAKCEDGMLEAVRRFADMRETEFYED
jgi:uncharacterized protein (TIGR02266 family)